MTQSSAEATAPRALGAGGQPESSVEACFRSAAGDLPQVITVPELANLLQVSRASAYRAIDREEVPGVIRVGRLIRISRPAVLAWLHAKGATHS